MLSICKQIIFSWDIEDSPDPGPGSTVADVKQLLAFFAKRTCLTSGEGTLAPAAREERARGTEQHRPTLGTVRSEVAIGTVSPIEKHHATEPEGETSQEPKTKLS